MSDIDPENATERELVVAAQEEICPTDDPAKRQWIMGVIENIAEDVRETYRQEQNAPSRAKLREKLERVESLSRELRTLIQDPHVFEGLSYGWSTFDKDYFERKMFEEMVDLRRARQETPNLLEILERASPAAVKVLGLKGRIGDVGPWWKISLPAKVQLAIFGRRLYEIANDDSKLRGYHDKQFQMFLQIVWQIATDEADVGDWANAIRVAGTRRLKPETDSAHISARKRADELLGSAFH